jgi:hypothetical protein
MLHQHRHHARISGSSAQIVTRLALFSTVRKVRRPQHRFLADYAARRVERWEISAASLFGRTYSTFKSHRLTKKTPYRVC